MLKKTLPTSDFSGQNVKFIVFIINFVRQLEEGGGKHLYLDMIINKSQMVNLVLRKGIGTKLCEEHRHKKSHIIWQP